jgi:enamine deaminase RidA (YjgF/YER057c/UK114 family)
MKQILKVILVMAFLFTQAAFAGKPEVEHYAVSADMQLPFSEAVRVGHMLYLSGQIGIDPATSKLAEGGIAGETRQVMENIKASLEKYGSSMAEVVKCTVYLADQSAGPQCPGYQRSGPRCKNRDRMFGDCPVRHSGMPCAAC